MRITPNLGIGDLLITKMRLITKDMKVNCINIQSDIVYNFRTHTDTYFRFLEDFIPRLFPQATIECDKDYTSTSIHDIRITECYLYPHYTFSIPRTVFSEQPYIIVHTRARFDEAAYDFFEKDLPLYKSSFSELTSEYPILLFGEKDIECNRESATHNIRSLHEHLLQIPGVIDMTRNTSASENSIEQFETDVHMINGAKCNVVFGYGGPLSLSMAFGRKTIGYIGGICHPVVDDYMELASLYRDMGTFFNVLRSELSIPTVP